jgi:undecaprenyl diphosphate synthase
MIRTGGDHRLSNFLLWQSAYAELFFCDDLWPDFSVEIFEKILKKFKKIERRYGGLK